jgi:hypothetical protein
MQLDLAVNPVAQQALLAVIDRQAGFVTGSFDAEYAHEAENSTQRLCIPRR